MNITDPFLYFFFHNKIEASKQFLYFPAQLREHWESSLSSFHQINNLFHQLFKKLLFFHSLLVFWDGLTVLRADQTSPRLTQGTPD